MGFDHRRFDHSGVLIIGGLILIRGGLITAEVSSHALVFDFC